MASIYVNGAVNDTAFCLDFKLNEMDLYNKLLTDDAFYTSYVYERIADGQITVRSDTITKITRFHGLEEKVIEDSCGTTVLVNYGTDGIASSSTEPRERNYESAAADLYSSENNSKLIQVSTGFGAAETKYLLHKYGIYMNNMGPAKVFKNKKAIWEKISSKLLQKYGLNKTAQQIENKYKTVMRIRKGVITTNSKSGAAKKDMPKDMPFEEELRVIETQDDSVQPEVLRSARNFKKLKPSHSSWKPSKFTNNKASKDDTDDTVTCTSASEASDEDDSVASNAININRQMRRKMHSSRQIESDKKKIRRMSIAEAIVMSTKLKEVAKDRRHKEKIKVLKQVHGKPNTDDSDSVESA